MQAPYSCKLSFWSKCKHTPGCVTASMGSNWPEASHKTTLHPAQSTLCVAHRENEIHHHTQTLSRSTHRCCSPVEVQSCRRRSIPGRYKSSFDLCAFMRNNARWATPMGNAEFIADIIGPQDRLVVCNTKVSRQLIETDTIKRPNRSEAFMQTWAQWGIHKGIRHPLVLKFVSGTELVSMLSKMQRSYLGVGKWHSQNSIHADALTSRFKPSPTPYRQQQVKTS